MKPLSGPSIAPLTESGPSIAPATGTGPAEGDFRDLGFLAAIQAPTGTSPVESRAALSSAGLVPVGDMIDGQHGNATQQPSAGLVPVET